MTNPKYLYLILAIVVLAIFSVVGYWTIKNQATTPAPSSTSTKTDETTNWQTHEGKIEGFSFKYPDGLKLVESADQKVVYLDPLPKSSDQQLGTAYRYIVNVTDLETNQKGIDGLTKELNDEFTKSDVTIGGRGATRFKDKSANRSDFIYFIDVPILIQNNNPDLNDQKDLLFDQILTTFKFTK